MSKRATNSMPTAKFEVEKSKPAVRRNLSRFQALPPRTAMPAVPSTKCRVQFQSVASPLPSASCSNASRTPELVDRMQAPGPPDIGEAVRRRERALHALAQMQLFPSHTWPLQREDNCAGSETDAAVTLSDTLSAATPFASPRGTELRRAGGPAARCRPLYYADNTRSDFARGGRM